MKLPSFRFALFATAALALVSELLAQLPPFSYRGLYEGTLTDGTKAYFFVRKDGDARFAQFDSVNHTTTNATFQVSANGSFAFMVGTVPIAGTFSSTGVTGSISALVFNLSRTTLNSVGGGLEGYYSGWSFDPNGGGTNAVQDVQFVFTPSGNLYGLLTRSSINVGPVGPRAFLGTYLADGTITASEITQGNSFTYSGNLLPVDGVLTGSLVVRGLSAPYDLHYYQAAKENVGYRLTNISTRAFVGTAANQAIAGFVIKNGAKRVLIRVIGPSLVAAGVPGALPDPAVTLYSGSTPIATNDNWKLGNDVAAIQATGFAPSDDRESALLVTLEEGAYTAIVSGIGGSTGVALVEVYEID